MNHTTTVNFLAKLQSQNYYELGYLPKGSLSQYAHRNQVILAQEHNDPCGYLLFYDGRNHHRPLESPDTLRIRQACIDYDLRRIEHGTRMIDRLINHAKRLGYRKITCWVGADLQANAFWKAMGFRHDATRTNQGRKHPVHFHYTLDIPPDTPDLTLPASQRI